jgi:hypothetical protein
MDLISWVQDGHLRHFFMNMVISNPPLETGEFLDSYLLLKNELRGLILIFLFICKRFLFNNVSEIKSC